MQNPADHTEERLRPQALQAVGQDDTIDLRALLASVLRGKYILVLSLIFGAGLGLANVLATTALYSASTTVRISSPEVDSERELSGVTIGTIDDISTEVLVIRSERIASRVVDDLELATNTTFFAPPHTGVSRIIGFATSWAARLFGVARSTVEERLGLSSADASLGLTEFTEEQIAQANRDFAVSILQGGMRVRPVEGSRVLSIRYTSVSPNLSIEVANGIANAYIDEQISSKFEASQRATDWLGERAEELRQQVIARDQEIEAFRRNNNLLDIGGDTNSETELERLDELVADARSRILDLEARSRRLEDIVAAADPTVVVSATASQGITSDLRSRYLETLSDYNALRVRLGISHEQTQRRRRELDDLQVLMFEEVKRAADVVRSELDSELALLLRLEDAQKQAERRFGADNQVLVQLRELEQNAETVRSLYTAYLERYQQSLQQQNFTVSDARVLNPARIPRQTAPNTRRTITLWALIGLMIGAVLVFFREVRDNRLRSEEQVRRALGLEYLGELPTVRGKSKVTNLRKLGKKDLGPREIMLPEMMRYAVDQPFSGYTEMLRGGKIEIKLRHGEKPQGAIVGLVSAFSGEGKTTIAANFAALSAHQGASTILIDCDLRNPGLSRALGNQLEHGLLEVLIDGKPWQDAYYTDHKTGLHIIGNRRERVANTADVIGGPAMEDLLDELVLNYDYVILDLPPLGPVIDARAVLHNLDGVFVVAKWGGVNLRPLQRILRADPRLHEKSYGMILNMFDPQQAASYGIFQSSYYDPTGYSRYHDDP